MSGDLPFDFAALDEVAIAAGLGRLSGNVVPPRRCRDLGPLIEFLALAAERKTPTVTESPWLNLGPLSKFEAALRSGKVRWHSSDEEKMGFLNCRDRTEHSWEAVQVAAQRAAKQVGFPVETAAKLIAAFGEMQSNVLEHSEAPDTGICAYRATANRFEFVVVDAGIGVRNSFKSNPNYQDVIDDNSALKLAITNGASRLVDPVRGFGFRQIFVSLANMSGHLRFRSGTGALTIDGRDPEVSRSKTWDRPNFRGLLVSVVCEHPRSKPDLPRAA